MFQKSEIINLLFSLAAVIVIFGAKKIEIPGKKFIYAGLLFMFSGYFFTVIEGVIWRDFFNLLEHAGYAMSGISFALACRLIIKSSKDRQEKF